MGADLTTFKSSLAICGLSQVQASDYLDVSLQTVKYWSSCRRNPPEVVWVMLSELFERIQDAADFAAKHMDFRDIDPRAYGQIDADCGPDPLPQGSSSVAGAMALLLALQDR